MKRTRREREEEMANIRSFKELTVWQRAMDVAMDEILAMRVAMAAANQWTTR